MMDQSIVAGIGNIYRSEVLFLNGVHPRNPGPSLALTTWRAMWKDLTRLMLHGADAPNQGGPCGKETASTCTIAPRSRAVAAERRFERCCSATAMCTGARKISRNCKLMMRRPSHAGRSASRVSGRRRHRQKRRNPRRANAVRRKGRRSGKKPRSSKRRSLQRAPVTF